MQWPQQLDTIVGVHGSASDPLWGSSLHTHAHTHTRTHTHVHTHTHTLTHTYTHTRTLTHTHTHTYTHTHTRTHTHTLTHTRTRTHTHVHSHTYTHTHTHTHTLTHTHSHTHTHTHTHTLTHTLTHTHTHTVYKVRKQRKIVCNQPVYVDYGYRLGIFTVISHVCVPLLCTQCFYTSTIPVAGTILSDCVSVYTLCTNVSTLVLYQ